MKEAKLKEKLNKKEIVVLCFILLLGLILRIYDLGSKSISLDEGLTVDFCDMSIKNMLIKISANGQQPLYYLFMHYWIKVFGQPEFVLRLPNVFLGVITIFMAYKVGKVLFNKHTGIICSFITSLSIFQINYSQEARPYMLSTLLSLISIYFLRIMLYKRSFKTQFLYIISTTLLIYNHSLGLFTILAQNIFSFLITPFIKEKSKTFIKDWFVSQIVVLIIFAPWAYLLFLELNQVGMKFLFTWVAEPTLKRVYETFTLYFSSSEILLTIFGLLIIKLLLSNYKNRFIVLLIILILTPIICMFIISKVWINIYIPRYTLPASIAFYMLVAASIDKLSQDGKIFTLLLICVFSVYSINNFYTSSYLFTYRQEKWREIIRSIEDNAKQNDLIIFDPWYIKDNFYDYYSRRTDLIKKGLTNLFKGERFINVKINPDYPLEKFDRIWFLLKNPKFIDSLSVKKIFNTYNLIEDNKYIYDIEVKLYSKENLHR